METYSLITRLNNVPDGIAQNSRDGASLFDAAFRIPGVTRLQLDEQEWRARTAEYLDYAVSRTRNDLRCHIQRLYLHINRQDAEAVYGALVDLFIILKETGRPLRERMLNVSRIILDDEKRQFLVRHLDKGITATDAIPPSKTSLFSKGLSGSNRLVIKLETREVPQQDPLEEARDHIEYGQVDEARQVLEAAILEEPLRPILHHDLLEIYKSTKAKEQFLEMRRRINPDTNPAADDWQKLAEFFT